MAAALRYEVVDRPCPLCGRRDPQPYLTTGDVLFGYPGTFHVVQCSHCTMLYTNPMVRPEDLSQFYPADYTAHQAKTVRQRRLKRRGKDVWDRLPDIGRRRLLDVGCGSGSYLQRQRARGWAVLGVEPSPHAVRRATEIGLRVIQGMIPGAALPEQEFEVITLLGVLDHLPDPRATLDSLRRMLAPHGRLIALVPNVDSTAARLFGGDWPGWDLPRHQNHFTGATLRQMLARAGLAQVRILYRRRPSRWRQGAEIRAAGSPAIAWRLLARSRLCCRLAAAALSPGARHDELIAVATHEQL